MARNVKELVARMSALGLQKESSEIENTPDPSEKGPVTVPEGDSKSAPPMPENKDEANETLAGGQETTESGDGKGPDAEKKPFEEQGVEASNKSASGDKLSERLEGLRSKLATLFQKETASKDESVKKAVKEAESEEEKEDDKEEEDGEKCAKAAADEAASAPGFFHLKVAEHLLATESGRSAIMEAIEEINGREYAQELVKKAAAEQEAFEKAYVEQQLESMQRAEQMKQAAAWNQHVEGLIKEASEEDKKEIELSSILINRGRACLNHDVLKYAYDAGVGDALAYDQAMESGQDPMAGAMPEDDSPPTPDEVAEVLMELVQEGAIAPEQAEQVLQEYVAAIQEATGGAGEMGPEMGGELPKEAAEEADKLLRKTASMAGFEVP